tara:strand:+ start:1986 stop:2474 length:489 start_codon:yes stop_codon:yes gene_type:complete
MANLIDPNEMMFTSFQPKVANRYVMYIDGIPSFLIKKAARPSVKFNTITMDHMNTQRKIQGKASWDDITVTLYDPIVPSGAQATMEWVRLGYESVTGRAGYSDFYKKDIVFNVLGPVGDKVEEWTLKGAFVTSAGFGEMDWSSDTPMEISIGIAYDYAILQY